MDDLPDEARFAHARLPDHSDHLTAAEAGLVEGISELFKFFAPADKAREPARRRGLETGAGQAGPDQLKCLDWLTQPLDRRRTERVDLNKALDQVKRPLGEPDTTGRRELLHAGRQVRGLADGGVVHAQIATNGAHDDVPGVDPDADLHLHALRAAKLI